MQVIPPSEQSHTSILRSFLTERKDFNNMLDKVFSAAEDTSTANSDANRKLLKNISTGIANAANAIGYDDDRSSLFDTILKKGNELGPNQKDALLASLTTVQKAINNFMNTVASIFGVDTRQAA